MNDALATPAQLWRMGAVLGVASLPALIAPGAIARAAALASETSPGREYLAAGHPGLAYGIVPIVALSATLLLLAPGLFIAMRLGRSRSLVEWLFTGFTCSLVVVSVVSAIVQGFAGESLRGTTYALTLIALAAACFAALLPVLTRQAVPWPLARPSDRSDAIMLLGFWAIASTLLTPKLLWESFNGDGAHAFESSRLLLRHALPFWSSDAGPVAGFPGMTSMLYAFPNAWFLRLFGEVEYAARIPLLLYVPVVACGIRLLGDVGAPREDPGPLAKYALLASLFAYLLAMAWSASYNPYSADVALPATQDTLLMIAYIGALLASLRGTWGWMALYFALTWFSLPSGLILIGFWLVARFLVERPVPWRDLSIMAGTLVGTAVVAGMVPPLLSALGSAPPGGEYGLVGILRYFAFLQFTDLTRLLYVAIPAGVLPVAALVMWRSHDRVSRALTLVTLAYFLFFFVQAHVSLHHFVPAMLLPMAVAWRDVTRPTSPRHLPALWLGAATVAVLLAFPWGRVSIHRDGRDVGRAITVRIPGYDRSSAEVMRASTLMDRLFAYDWDPQVPATYGGSPLVWNHYARHASAPEEGSNYIVQRTADPAPEGWHLAGADSTGASLYVRDESVLASDRQRQPVTPPGSRWLAVPRGILFHGVPLEGGPRIIDVAETLIAWGLPVDAMLGRLGARRGS